SARMAPGGGTAVGVPRRLCRRRQGVRTRHRAPHARVRFRPETESRVGVLAPEDGVLTHRVKMALDGVELAAELEDVELGLHACQELVLVDRLGEVLRDPLGDALE